MHTIHVLLYLITISAMLFISFAIAILIYYVLVKVFDRAIEKSCAKERKDMSDYLLQCHESYIEKHGDHEGN